MRPAFTYICIILIPLIISACGKTERAEWTEDVRLMNGELVKIARKNFYGDIGDITYPQGPLARVQISFSYKGKRYEWAQRGVDPMSLQLDGNGRFYIVGIIPYRWACSEWSLAGGVKKTRGLYIAFQENSGQWSEIPLSEISISPVFNLVGSNRAYRGYDYLTHVPEDDPRKPYHKEAMPEWYKQYLPENPATKSCY